MEWTQRTTDGKHPWRGAVAAVAIACTATLGASPAHADVTLDDDPPTGAKADQYRRDFLDLSPDRTVMPVGHLSAWREAPENSISGLRLAIELGVPIAEIDVRQTKDGHYVLMHDETVDRTTEGQGRVDELTLEEVTALRVKELRGGEHAALTDEHVPTLREIFQEGKGRILFNLDKSWEYRDELVRVAEELGVEDQLIFKSDASIKDVDSFMQDHGDALYCHIIDDGNVEVAHQFVREPDCYEVVWDDLDDAQVDGDYLASLRQDSRVFMNTMWYGLAGRYTDEAALRDPSLGWEPVVDMGADMIQTDDPQALIYWLEGNDIATYDLPASSVRVRAENYLESHDPNGKLKTCDAHGNVHVCWIREGSWLKYEVDFPRAGIYSVRGRVASSHPQPTGAFQLEFDEWASEQIKVRHTTGNQYFLDQDFNTAHAFDAGSAEFYVRIAEDEFQNFNLDWIQFDLVTAIVEPAEPTFQEGAEGGPGHSYTIPDAEGVRYYLGEARIEAGSHPAAGTVMIRAEPEDGYAFPDSAVTSWSHTFADVPAPEEPDPSDEATGGAGPAPAPAERRPAGTAEASSPADQLARTGVGSLAAFPCLALLTAGTLLLIGRRFARP